MTKSAIDKRVPLTPYYPLVGLAVGLAALTIFSVQDYQTLHKLLSRDAIRMFAWGTAVATVVVIPLCWLGAWVWAARDANRKPKQYRSDRFVHAAYFLFVVPGAFCALLVVWSSALKEPYPAHLGQPLETSLIQAYTGLWREYSTDAGLKFSTCSDGPYDGNCYLYLNFEIIDGELEKVVDSLNLRGAERMPQTCPTGFCASWWPAAQQMSSWASYTSVPGQEPDTYSDIALWYDPTQKQIYFWVSQGPFDL